MNALIRFLSGVEPRPAPGGKFRREGCLCIAVPDAALPPDFPVMEKTEHPVKDSRSVAAFRSGDGRFFVKIYKFRKLVHALKYAFRTPRAFRCFAAAGRLRNNGFATPEAVAAAVRYRFGVPTRQILLTAALPEDTVFLDRELAAAEPDAALAILRELAAFAARLHQAGLLHGDLSLRNIYRVPGDKKFGLIDLDGLLIARMPLRRTAAVNELARILASAFRVSANLRDRDACVREVLKSYRDAGGMELRPEELAPVIRRLERHVR